MDHWNDGVSGLVSDISVSDILDWVQVLDWMWIGSIGYTTSGGGGAGAFFFCVFSFRFSILAEFVGCFPVVVFCVAFFEVPCLCSPPPPPTTFSFKGDAGCRPMMDQGYSWPEVLR